MSVVSYIGSLNRTFILRLTDKCIQCWIRKLWLHSIPVSYWSTLPLSWGLIVPFGCCHNNDHYQNISHLAMKTNRSILSLVHGYCKLLPFMMVWLFTKSLYSFLALLKTFNKAYQCHHFFLSFYGTKMVQVLKICLRRRKLPIYHAKSISFLPIWRRHDKCALRRTTQWIMVFGSFCGQCMTIIPW